MLTAFPPPSSDPSLGQRFLSGPLNVSEHSCGCRSEVEPQPRPLPLSHARRPPTVPWLLPFPPSRAAQTPQSSRGGASRAPPWAHCGTFSSPTSSSTSSPSSASCRSCVLPSWVDPAPLVRRHGGVDEAVPRGGRGGAEALGRTAPLRAAVACTCAAASVGARGNGPGAQQDPLPGRGPGDGHRGGQAFEVQGGVPKVGYLQGDGVGAASMYRLQPTEVVY